MGMVGSDGLTTYRTAARTVAIAADYRGFPGLVRRSLPRVSMIDTTEFSTHITAARAVATTVAFAVQVP